MKKAMGSAVKEGRVVQIVKRPLTNRFLKELRNGYCALAVQEEGAI